MDEILDLVESVSKGFPTYSSIKYSRNYWDPPVVFGSWGGGWPFMFRELGSTSNYFQGAGEQACNL